MLPPQLERLRPFEPMRFLHLVYLLMFLIAGGLIGQHVLGKHAYRWVLLFVPLSAGMFYAQRQMYPSTAHLQLPGRAPSNDWLRAFAWIRKSTPRQNTPTNALFALDPYYMQQPGEDFHGFRALAERSALADMVKDPGMVARVPSLSRKMAARSERHQKLAELPASRFCAVENDLRSHMGSAGKIRRCQPVRNRFDLPLPESDCQSLPHRVAS